MESASPTGPAQVWERWSGPGAVRDAVATTRGIVAVGSQGAGNGSQPAAWFSTDGSTWSAGKIEGGGQLVAVTRGPGVYLGVGQRTVAEHAQAATWMSVNGQDWWLGGVPETTAGCQSALSDVAWSSDAVVVVGVEWGEGGCLQHGAAWRSLDGIAWTRATLDQAGNAIRRVAASPHGFVAAGVDNAPAGEATHAMMWTSSDGRSWTAADDVASFANAEPASLLLLPDASMLASGAAIAPDLRVFAPILWRGVVGGAWATVESPGLVPAPAASTAAAAPSGATGGRTTMTLTSQLLDSAKGLIAMGASMAWDGEAGSVDAATAWRYVLWTSRDARSWTPVPDDPLLEVGRTSAYVLGPDAAVVAGDRILLFGTTYTVGKDGGPGVRTPTIWAADLLALQAPG